MLRSAGSDYRFLVETLGIWLPRVRIECEFYRPVKLDELLVVETFFSRIGRTSIHLDFAVARKANPEELVATGKYVLVCVRQGDFKPVPVPEQLRDRIGAYLEPSSDEAPPPRPSR